jgi:ketosteroid isomerase-like protein
MKLATIIAAAALAAQPSIAQTTQHPVGHQAMSGQTAEGQAVKDVLARFHSAIERLDAKGTEQLFAADSSVFETGGSEGTYANYLSHHLGPELGEFKSFKFSDYKVDVRFEGPVALATESYKYRIETKTGVVAERIGVTTSVLKKVDGQWKILVSHNSGRKPKGS